MVMLGEFIYRQYPCSAVCTACVYYPSFLLQIELPPPPQAGGGIFDPPDLCHIDGEVIIDSSPPHGITLTTMVTHGHVNKIEALG